MIERVDDVAVIGYRVVVVESPDLGVELAYYFQVIQIDHVRSDDGFPDLFTVFSRNSCSFIVKEFLSHRFVIQIQYRNMSERTDCPAVFILA